MIDKDLTFSDILNWFKSETNRTEDSYNKFVNSSSPRTAENRLSNIKKVYNVVWDHMKPQYKRFYIHDDTIFNKIENSIQDCINNKIKLNDNKQVIYIDNLMFDGSQEMYDKYFSDSAINFSQIINKIFDELQNVVVETINNQGENKVLVQMPTFITEYVSTSIEHSGSA